MEGRAILRLVHKTVEPVGARSYGSGGLLGGGPWRVEEYRVSLAGLIVQDPSMVEVALHRGPLALAPQPWSEYCRWHSGPLAERDDPLQRIYCNVRVKPGRGYCRQHWRSERAVYDACMSLHGERGLEACRLLDRMVRAEYAVYMLDYGGQRPKVGSTRLFRLRERVAEQVHLVATLVAVFDSAYQARRAEVAIARSGLAGETGLRRRRATGPPRGVGAAATRLSAAAEKAARLVGASWEGRLFRVLPPWESWPGLVDPERLAGATLEPAGFWGGLLAFSRGGRLVAVEERRLAHRDSLIVYPGSPPPSAPGGSSTTHEPRSSS